MSDKKKASGKKKKVVRRIVLWLLLLIVVAVAAFVLWSKLRAEYRITYNPYTATTGTISNSLSFSGSMQLVDSMSYSPTSSATVRNVYVATGDKVKKGDRLIRLSNGDSFTADFDGTVNVVNFQKDDEVYSGDTLLQIADFEHMKVQVRVDEYDISDVHPGDACTVTLTALEQKYASVIDSINYISSSGGNVAYYTATVYVDVETGIYPGMQATVTVPQEEATDVVILKADALAFDITNQAYVWKMGEDGTMTKENVEVGVSNGNYVEIKSGVISGETIYTEAKAKEADALTGLLSGMFGSQQINSFGGGMPGNFGNQGGGFNRNGGNSRNNNGNGRNSGSGSGRTNNSGR